MKLFFDCEFTGLHKNTTLISLGIVAEDGKKFYAEFTDYNEGQCGSWIKENVIGNLVNHRVTEMWEWRRMRDNSIARINCLDISYFPDPKTDQFYYVTETHSERKRWAVGDRNYIYYALKDWLSQFDSIQFVSDVCHYDFVLLIDLLTNGGTALDLPENISAVCHDINSDIARHYGIFEKEAFDKSREEIVSELCGKPVFGNKHNALYDAEVIKAIYGELG